MSKRLQPVIDKLDGHSKHLLDFYLTIERKNAIARTMLFEEYSDTYSGSSAAAFDITRDTLYMSVIQDLAAIIFDNDNRTPSIASIVDTLQDSAVSGHFRSSYIPAHGYEPPDKQRIERENAVRFDNALSNLKTNAAGLTSSADAIACKTARNKYIAHYELASTGGGNYVRIDPAVIGLKWKTPTSILERIRPIIVDATLVIRSAGFAWEMWDEQNESMRKEFSEALR